MQVLNPWFEAEFEDCSFAYRQGRGVRQAVERIQLLQRQGYRWVVDADIEAFFDRIPHEPLLTMLTEMVPADPGVVQLVRHWLQTPVLDRSHGEGGPQPSLCGVPQGMPISPALANLYLDHLDEALLDEDLALVRYADDFVILTRRETQAHQAMALTEGVLRDLQLKLNSHKTRIVNLDQDGLDFLGHSFVRGVVVCLMAGILRRICKA